MQIPYADELNKQDCFKVVGVPSYAVQYRRTKYAVTKAGDVYCILTGDKVEPRSYDGYKYNRVAAHRVDSMVAEVFIRGGREMGADMAVRHIDDNPFNDAASNLEIRAKRRTVRGK